MKKIAIIAGNGKLPFEVANLLAKRQYHCHIFGIKGEVKNEIKNFSHTFISLGQVGKLLKELKNFGTKDILLLGGVMRRPTFWQLKFDFGIIKILPLVLKILSKGDNSLLLECINWFERQGFKVKTMAEIAPELLIGKQDIFGKKPAAADIKRLKHGLLVVQDLSKYDIGQGAVVVGERVVAIEGVEGTDSMLTRVAKLKAQKRLPKKGGVLVKSRKLGQDNRVDLPAIGPKTIHNLFKAGLSGVGVEAGHTIIIERKKTLALVKKYKLFIYGLSTNEK